MESQIKGLEKPLGMRIGESAFCVCYLAFTLAAGAFFILTSGDGGEVGAYSATCALMTLLLGGGDAFHLVPRIVANVRGPVSSEEDRRHRAFWLGLGNLVSSITMTLFYLLFFRAMTQVPGRTVAPSSSHQAVFAILAVLAAVRIALCLFPQNKWFDGEGNQLWGIYRNIPFVAIGFITIIYLIAWYGEWLMAFLVCASFACYMGVVLYAKEKPMMGMLMIPKTICYVVIISMLLARL